MVEFTLLLIGPPGVAKSMLTRKAAEVISNSRYVKARNASGNGITAGKAGAALSSGGDGEVATTKPSVSLDAHVIDEASAGETREAETGRQAADRRFMPSVSADTHGIGDVQNEDQALEGDGGTEGSSGGGGGG